MADLAVLEQECIRNGLPRPSAGLDAGEGGGVARRGLPEADAAQAPQGPVGRLSAWPRRSRRGASRRS
jgi:hypothetical protein